MALKVVSDLSLIILTDSDVSAWRVRMARLGLRQIDLSNSSGISRSTICNAFKRRKCSYTTYCSINSALGLKGALTHED